MAERRVPRIRFKGFEEDWEQRKLGEIGTVMMCRRVFKNQTSESGEIPFYKIGTFGGVADAFISKALFEEYRVKYPFPEKGDVLISASGSIGRTVEYTGEEAYFQDSNIVWLKHDESVINTFLRNAYEVVKWSGVEGSTIKRLYNDNILRTRIKIPTISEQEKIARFLDGFDMLLSLHQRKLEKLKILKKAMLEKMFPKNGAKVPEIRFSGFTDDWEQRKVSEMFKITRGYVLSATVTTEYPDDENRYPVYSSQTAFNGLLGYYKQYLYENAVTWTTDGANAGTVRYRDGKFYCTNVCGVLLSDVIKVSKMVAEALNVISKKYVSYVGNPKLMNNVMAEIVIAFPPQQEEQDAISGYFNLMDSLLSLHQRKLEKLRQIKKSMLERIFV